MRFVIIFFVLLCLIGCDPSNQTTVHQNQTVPISEIANPSPVTADIEAGSSALDSGPLSQIVEPVSGSVVTESSPDPRPEVEAESAAQPVAAVAESSPDFLGLEAEATVQPRAQPSPVSGTASSCRAPELMQRIPNRNSAARGGALVFDSLMSLRGMERDQQLVGEVLAGNIPNHLRTLVPITFSIPIRGQDTEITLCVMPDYLAVGGDSDFVRFPLGLSQTQRLLSATGFILPVRSIVDAIYHQASVKLVASPINFDADPSRYPGGYIETNMNHTRTILTHNSTIQNQLSGRSGLIAGHKKDIVSRVSSTDPSLCIYGWQRADGSVIQRSCGGHGRDYADYSHGIRLISETVFVQGQPRSYQSLVSGSL